MNNSDIQDTDFFMCEAFKQILTSPKVELEQKLGSGASHVIANYLTTLPSEDFQDPAIMANRIAAFCQRPENKNLQDWWGEIYDRLDEDGIDIFVKKSRDPGEEADDEPETTQIITNEGRDICQYLERWAQEVKSQDTQGNQDDSNSK
ncbi:hypothetical protein [Dendronalium sp. ChiSLP03b]|uniref:hypothetical protein n=1 Tax=Dendronalium sp. ChiSLP03b TaxID=3075381 RepID=UPI002AD1FDFA|nr:hypothetical protein [Dendronalium sp. ChiSLP03b]MDZ8209353.1 hypothetical protein [Dendronalium sp. ChiSLP03b]